MIDRKALREDNDPKRWYFWLRSLVIDTEAVEAFIDHSVSEGYETQYIIEVPGPGTYVPLEVEE